MKLGSRGWVMRPRCILCPVRREFRTWRRTSWHYWWSHPGVNKRFRGSLWRKR